LLALFPGSEKKKKRTGWLRIFAAGGGNEGFTSKRAVPRAFDRFSPLRSGRMTLKRRGFDSSYLAKEISAMPSYPEATALAQGLTITWSDPRSLSRSGRFYRRRRSRRGVGGGGGVKNEASHADV